MPDAHPANRTLPARRVGGRYVLGTELGRGGMASVHRAVDVVLQREVALKLPHESLGRDTAFVERFRREAQAAAALDHPNVVAVHDWGEDPQDGAYLVLQLVEGPSLRQLLHDAGRLDPVTAAAVLHPAATGLGAAHSAGFVHRDVKPENVLLGRDGTVRVTDFGLARAAASTAATFGPEVVVGSPYYLAPEAVRSESLDPRADVYALGVVLFECLTGRPPHDGDTPMAIAMAHTSTPVPPPSELVEGLDDRLDDLVLAATSIDRTHRPDDASLFAIELATLVPECGHLNLAGLAAQVLAGTTDAPPTAPPPAMGTREVPLEGRTTLFAGARTVSPSRRSRRHRTVARADTTRRARDADASRTGSDDAAPAAPRGVRFAPVTARRAPRDRTPRRAGGRWRRGAVLAIALIGLALAGGYLAWERVLAPVTPVPDLVGEPADHATEQLEMAGFRVQIAEERAFHRDLAEGLVTAHEPTGQARRGGLVTLVLSAGPRPVEVPEVTGTTADDALDALRAVGVETTVIEQHHDEVPVGVVIATSPTTGTVVDEGSTVEVTVSQGARPVEVPDVVGQTLQDARAAARAGGLGLVVRDRRHDAAPAGAIVDQDPEPGSTIARGDTVEVVVSEGPPPTEVPNVRGDRLGDAVATLEASGFEVAVELRRGSGEFVSPGQVFDQDPGPGAVRPHGDTVTVFAYEE